MAGINSPGINSLRPKTYICHFDFDQIVLIVVLALEHFCKFNEYNR